MAFATFTPAMCATRPAAARTAWAAETGLSAATAMRSRHGTSPTTAIAPLAAACAQVSLPVFPAAGAVAVSRSMMSANCDCLLVGQVGRTIVEVQDPPLAGPLATQKRVVRAAQELVLIDLGAVVVGGGHTEGRAHDAVFVDGLARQGLQDAAGNHARLGGAGFGEQDDELVSAEASHDVYLTQSGTQALRHGHQHAIAGLVAEAVVDLFEP